MRPAIAIALFPSLALADSSIGDKPKPQPLPSASAPWAKACVARFADARAKSVTIDKTFENGSITVSVKDKIEHVAFTMPVKEPPPAFTVEVYAQSDRAFAADVAPRPPLSPRLMDDGWYFFPNHPNHSFPPSVFSTHKNERTADLTNGWGSRALEDLWKRAAEDCLVMK